MVEIMKTERGGGDAFECPVPGQNHHGVANHPLSSANPPGLPRPPLHPLQHTHGHSHLIGGMANHNSHSNHNNHNGSPMQRLQGGLHHGGHGPAPPPPTHISNPPSSSSHPMTTLTSSQSVQHGGPQGPASQTLVSNGGLNGHTNHAHQAAQLFGDTEPENEKWWWVCCLEFCFCLLWSCWSCSRRVVLIDSYIFHFWFQRHKKR